jgi:hypothetical protein
MCLRSGSQEHNDKGQQNHVQQALQWSWHLLTWGPEGLVILLAPQTSFYLHIIQSLRHECYTVYSNCLTFRHADVPLQEGLAHLQQFHKFPASTKFLFESFQLSG